MILDVRRPADPVAELREGENGAEHLRAKGGSDIWIHRGAPPQDATEVQHLERVTDADVTRDDPRIAAERAPGSQRAGENIAGPKLQHAPGHVLDRVVRRFVLQDAYGQHVPFAGQDLVANDHLGREPGVAG
jgi:hypothetical protein